MSRQVGDGSQTSSFFKVGDPKTGKDQQAKGTKIVQGQIKRVHYVDDRTNKSKQFVEYDIIIRESSGNSSTYQNVPYMGDISSGNDSSETVLEPSDFAYQGKLDDTNVPKNKNGTLVYVAFLDGNLDKPFILGGSLHFRQSPATRADGIRKKGEFRGLQWEINNLGELTITYNGNRKPDGTLERSDTGPTQIKVDKDGVFTLTDNQGQKIEMNRTTKTITLSNGTTVTFDGTGDKIRLEAAGGGTLDLTDGKVALGTSAVEVLDKLSTAIDLVSQWAQNIGATHDHLGNLGYPTAPPTQASDYTQLGTDLDSEKSDVDSIKGSI